MAGNQKGGGSEHSRAPAFIMMGSWTQKGEDMKVRESLLLLIGATMVFCAAGIENRGKEGLGLTGADKKQDEAKQVVSTKDLLKDLADDTDFLRVGDDVLTWGVITRQVDASIGTSLSKLFLAPQNEMNDLLVKAYAAGVSKFVRQYLMTSLVAQEARRLGIVIEDKEFQEEEAKLRKLNDVGSFQYQFMTNAVYQRAYVVKYLKPSISISSNDVASLIKSRHEANLSVPATNELFRAQLADLRERLVRNEISWGEAADEYSDCPDCSSEDGDCGTWEENEDSEDRPPQLLKAAFSIPTNTVSEVVATDSAFHLIKVMERYEPTAKAREEDGEVASVDVRHIQIDKWQVDPEFTQETARAFLENRALGRVLKSKQAELLKGAKVECVIPLFAPGGNGRRSTTIFRKK